MQFRQFPSTILCYWRVRKQSREIRATYTPTNKGSGDKKRRYDCDDASLLRSISAIGESGCSPVKYERLTVTHQIIQMKYLVHVQETSNNGQHYGKILRAEIPGPRKITVS